MDDTSRWWPDPMGQMFWPAQIDRAVDLASFARAFALLGYHDHSDETLETSVEKIGLFADPSGTPTHAARQLPNGRWTSKLAVQADIEHELRTE
jgi:hypothetical protein